MSPGQYLRRRREAAGLSIEDLAVRFNAVPDYWSARDRADWFLTVEADIAPIPAGVAVMLRYFVRFNPIVLDALVARRAGLPVPLPRLCRECACSEWDPCERGCSWVETDPDLCSRCAGEGAPDEEPELLADALQQRPEVAARA